MSGKNFIHYSSVIIIQKETPSIIGEEMGCEWTGFINIEFILADHRSPSFFV